MLKNAYLLAKIGADTAENERTFSEILPKIGNYPTGPPRFERTAQGDRPADRAETPETDERTDLAPPSKIVLPRLA